MSRDTGGIPVTVVGGYLGAGKTTLVNHLLRNARGERIAVLVNDFGDVGIDAELIESRDGDVINLAGGCVCCSFGSDLMAALMRLPAMEPPPDRAIVETSGVALPRPVARTVGLARGLVPDAVVVLADAATLPERAADRYVGDTVLGQLREADLILLNKVDLVDEAALRRLHAWLRENAPQAAVVDTEHGAIDPALLFGPPVPRPASAAQRPARESNLPARRASDRPPERGRNLPSEPASDRPPARRGLAPPAGHRAAVTFESLSWRFDCAVDVTALAEVLRRPELGIARAKGLVTGTDARVWLVQAVGPRVETFEQPDRAPDGGGRLACIGARGRFERHSLAAALAAVGAGTQVAGG